MHVHLLARFRRFTYARRATTRQRNLLPGFSRGSRRWETRLSFSRALCRCDTRKQHVSRMNSHGGLARVLSFPLWLPGGRMYPPSRSPLSCPSPAFTRPFFSLSFPESAGIFGTLKKPRWHTVPLLLPPLRASHRCFFFCFSSMSLLRRLSLALPRSLREH